MFGVSDPATEAAVGTYVKLLRAARALIARVEPLLATQALTATQLGVLEAILHKGALTQRELGRKVLTSAANMTDIIDKLEARLLVTRVRCPEDRRQVRVELTECGRALIQDLFPRHAQDIARGMAGLDTEQLHQLGALLRKLGMTAAQGGPEPSLAKSCPGDHLPSRSFDIERSCDEGQCNDPGGTV